MTSAINHKTITHPQSKAKSSNPQPKMSKAKQLSQMFFESSFQDAEASPRRVVPPASLTPLSPTRSSPVSSKETLSSAPLDQTKDQVSVVAQDVLNQPPLYPYPVLLEPFVVFPNPFPFVIWQQMLCLCPPAGLPS